MAGEIQIRTVDTENFAMDYFSFGQGPRPLVIIPGVSVKSVMLSAAAVADAYADFAETHTVYVFDRKRDIRAGYDTIGMADDEAAAMRALGISEADVFGASQGGMIAQCIAARHPELVRRLVLASTLSRQNEVSRATFDGWCALADAGDVCALNRDISHRVYSPKFYDRFREAFEALETEGTDAEMRRFSILVKACRTFEAYEQLDRIKCPTLVIGSWDDCVLSGEGSVEIARRLRCPVWMYSGYGHAVYDEAPDYRAHLHRFFDDEI